MLLKTKVISFFPPNSLQEGNQRTEIRRSETLRREQKKKKKMETKSPDTCPYSVTVRRNPHRKARPTTSTKCQQHVSVPPLEVPSFPIDDILAMEVPQNPNPNPNSDSVSENLKVFLRIRPILPSASPAKDQNLKPRSKNAWPKNPAKKNPARERAAKKKSSGEVCITVNDSQSVTLSPPLVLQESKRIKSEVYEGFSHVFAPDSSQVLFSFSGFHCFNY